MTIDNSGNRGKAVFLALDLNQLGALSGNIVERSLAYFETGITSANEGIPTLLHLSQNYPNPFNPMTRIKFSIYRPTVVSLKIYNTAGQLVRTLIKDEIFQTSDHEVIWDGRNDFGKSVSSGLYFYRLDASGEIKTKKMIFLK